MKSPTDLPGRVLAFARDLEMLPPGATVLCALSGGADSMALLTCLRELAGDQGFTLLAAHYNHQLRGEESQRDEAFVTGWCKTHAVPLTVGRGDVAAEAARQGRGIEETARAMRYAFLEKTAKAVGADRIATAHNGDDNAETLLLHLVRGTGLDGLAGIPPARGPFVRPLLETTRQEIEAYLALRGVPWIQDSSNADPTYARNRIRRDVMPVLRDLNPAFSRTLAANLRHIRADRAYLEELAEPVSGKAQWKDGSPVLEAAALASLPRPVAVRAVKQVLARLGRHQISAVHLDQILDLDGPSHRLDLPQGLTVRREYDTLVFSLDQADDPPLFPVEIPGEGTYRLGDWRLELRPCLCPEHPVQGPYQWYLRREALTFPLEARTRQTGDTLRLPGRRQKPLKKWYIDEKIPRLSRDTLPVLADAQGLVAAAGLGPDERFLAAPGTPALSVALTKDRDERT
ncbi:MAG: tRNA lysidine(34) synthetase TilS [Evtepia sp.]